MPTRTFLFVDQVRSTEQLVRLGDQAGRHLRVHLLDLLREELRAHSGREIDAAGDGLLGVFSSAGEAVDAAIAMQQSVLRASRRLPEDRQLGVRAGVETGEPVPGPDGTYVGLAVVVAARLCATAVEGQVLVSDVVRSLVEPGGRHTFASVGALTLKGVPSPVPASALVWSPPQQERQLPDELRTAATTPFVGRTHELGALRDMWGRASDDRRALVLVSGEQGAGVTRIVAELAREVLSEGATVLYGRAAGPEVRWAAWADAVTTWLSMTPPAEARAALDGAAGRLHRLSPDLARLSAAPSVDVQAPSASDVFLVADGLDEVLSRLSARDPVLVVLDRLQQADRETFVILRRLAVSQRPGRLLLVGCQSLPEVGAPSVVTTLGDVPGLRELHLGGLDESEVSALLRHVSGEEPTPDRTRAVLAESEGNPYFVVAMALAHRRHSLTEHVAEAMGRTEGLRTDLRLRREEVSLGLRQLDQLRARAEAHEALVEPDGTAPVPAHCPFRGLLSFRQDDAQDFHGREALVAELTARLASSPFVAVVGPSGSGKSSVISAGLLPALAAGALPGSAGWTSVVVTPGDDALSSLAGALAARSLQVDAGRPAAPAAAVRRRLLVEPLGQVCGDLLDDRHTLLVLDQAEELWTTASEDSRDRLVRLISDPVTTRGARVRVVMALRGDYYGHAAAHEDLALLVSESQVLVGPLTDAELRAIVEKPARRAGLQVEPGLAQAVIDDAAREPGALPLVSTALLETWQRRRGTSLTLAGYAESGGVRGAIAHLAEAAHGELPDEEKLAARRLLLRLAVPRPDGQDVARRLPLRELGDDPGTQRALRLFVERRLLTVGADSVQVAHEALLREWPRLREWLDSDREGRRLHQQVAVSALEWDAADRDDDLLLRGPRLAAATEWRGAGDRVLTPLEETYIAASAQAHAASLLAARRSARRLRLLAVGLVVALALAAVGGVLATSQRRSAQQQAVVAVAERLSALASARAQEQPAQALLLAAEGFRRNRSAASHGALLDVVSTSPLLEQLQHVDGTPRALSADGRTLVAQKTPGALQVVDLRGGAEPRTTATVEHGEQLTSVAFSTAGDVVTGGLDGSLRHWSAPGMGQRLLASGGSGVVALAVSPDGRYLLSEHTDGALRLRTLPGGTTVGSLLPPDRLPVPFATAMSPDGRTMAVSVRGGAALLELPTLRRLATLSAVTEPHAVTALAFDPRGQLLATGTDQGSTVLWDVRTGRRQRTLSGNEGAVTALAFDSATRRLVAAGDPSALVLWDLRRSESEGRRLPGHSYYPHAVAFRPDGGLVSISAREAATWDFAGVQPGARLPGAATAVTAFSLSKDGRVMATADDDGRVRLRALPEGQPVGAPHELGATPVRDVSLSADGRRVAAVGGEAEAVLAVWDVASGRRLSVVRLEATPSRVVFSPDGRLLAVADHRGTVQLRSAADLHAVSGARTVRRFPGPVVGLAFSPDGRTVVTGGDSRAVFLEVPSARIVDERPMEAALTSVAFDPAGSLLALASDAGTVELWDAEEHEPVQCTPILRSCPPRLSRLFQRSTALRTAGFTADGRLLVTGAADGSVAVWDVAARRPLGHPMPAHPDAVTGVGALADGRAVSTGLDGSAVVWDFRPEALLAQACRLAGRNLTTEEYDEAVGSDYEPTCPQWPSALDVER